MEQNKYHQIEKILTDFKRGATYSDSIERIEALYLPKEKLEKVWNMLVDFKPECWPITIKSFSESQRYMGRVHKDDPFVSESSLYVILGKEDARTFRAILRNFAEVAGIEKEELYKI